MSIKALVLYGGTSKERDLSIKSGKAVSNALKAKGYDVIEYDFQNSIEEVVKIHKPDVVFIALHGKYGEDGTVQGALEILSVPYTGSSVSASALCMNRLFSKFMFREIEVKTPSFTYFSKDNYLPYSYVSELLGNKMLVIKPIDQGATIGVTIAGDEKTYNEGLSRAFELTYTVLVEEYIKGSSVTVALIGNYPDIHVLPIVEKVKENFYDSGARHIIPARLLPFQKSLAEEYARRIYKEFNLRDFACIDMIVNENDVYVLEVNTIPHFTETSLLGDAAKAENISFEDLVDFVVQEALQRKL